jgi:hypothetical protein
MNEEKEMLKFVQLCYHFYSVGRSAATVEQITLQVRTTTGHGNDTPTFLNKLYYNYFY